MVGAVGANRGVERGGRIGQQASARLDHVDAQRRAAAVATQDLPERLDALESASDDHDLPWVRLARQHASRRPISAQSATLLKGSA